MHGRFDKCTKILVAKSKVRRSLRRTENMWQFVANMVINHWDP
jgi:hypothetical protein